MYIFKTHAQSPQQSPYPKLYLFRRVSRVSRRTHVSLNVGKNETVGRSSTVNDRDIPIRIRGIIAVTPPSRSAASSPAFHRNSYRASSLLTTDIHGHVRRLRSDASRSSFSIFFSPIFQYSSRVIMKHAKEYTTFGVGTDASDTRVRSEDERAQVQGG